MKYALNIFQNILKCLLPLNQVITLKPPFPPIGGLVFPEFQINLLQFSIFFFQRSHEASIRPARGGTTRFLGQEATVPGESILTVHQGTPDCDQSKIEPSKTPRLQLSQCKLCPQDWHSPALCFATRSGIPLHYASPQGLAFPCIMLRRKVWHSPALCFAARSGIPLHSASPPGLGSP
jgi:hypothetical protein